MDILIVDDEPLARQRLKRLLVSLGYDAITEAGSGQEALKIINSDDPAVILLDIEMPGETGLQVAEKISALENPPAVIFTTAYDQYALDAFSTVAAGYLLKPVSQQQLADALNKAQTLNKAQLQAIAKQEKSSPGNEPRQHISSRSYRGVDLIPVASIGCFLADSKYITVVSTSGESLIDSTLKELEAEFATKFVRIHRNALVSIERITGLERSLEGHYSVCLQGIDYKPMVSRRYASQVKALLKTL